MRLSLLVLLAALTAFPAAALPPADPPSPAPESEARDTEPPESEEDAPKVEETIVVTATRGERKVSELPVSATVVTEEQLEHAPALFVEDVIRTIPGVHMNFGNAAASSASNARISMHGLGGTRVLVLLDGIPMHDPYYGTVQWQKVPLDSLRQVEVVRGGNASLFGSAALGGTINLLTRPVETSEARLDLSLGTADTQRQSLTVDQALTPGLGVRLSHLRFSTNGFIRVPNPGPVDVRGWNDSSISNGRIDWSPSERTRAFLKASLTNLDVNDVTLLAFTDRDIFDAAGNVQTAVGANGLLSFTLFHQDQEELRVGTAVQGARETEFIANRSVIPATATGGSAEWSLQRSGRLSLVSLGVDVNRIEAVENRDTLTRTGVLTQQNVVAGRQQFSGLFGQATWHPTDRLEILASARVDYYENTDGRDEVVGGAVTVYPESSTTQFDPRISFRYGIGNGSAVRGSVYRAFKAPTLREMYRTGRTGNTLTLGNPFLQPETMVGAEVGVEWAFPRTRVELNVFRSDIDALQSRGQIPGQPNVIQPVNLGKSRSQGVELMIDSQLSRRWSMNIGYTYADSAVTEDPDPALVGKWLQEVVPHIGSLSLRHRRDDGTNVDLRYRVLSRSYGEATNAVPAPAHRVLDIGASRPLGRGLTAYVLLENAFDEKYWYVLSPVSFRSAQPRSFTGGVRWNIPFGSRGDA